MDRTIVGYFDPPTRPLVRHRLNQYNCDHFSSLAMVRISFLIPSRDICSTVLSAVSFCGLGWNRLANKLSMRWT